jgi:hypothetical protein
MVKPITLRVMIVLRDLWHIFSHKWGGMFLNLLLTQQTYQAYCELYPVILLRHSLYCLISYRSTVLV